jgi:hypothetical protein
MTKRGKVLRDTNVGPGLMTVEGKQYSLRLEGMWQSEIPPRPGMTVEVKFDSEGVPFEVFAVSESQIAKEQAQRALDGALRHGGAFGESLKSGSTGRIHIPVFVAEGILLLGFFALPNLRVGNGFISHSFNGWDAIGLDINTGMTSDHGLLSLVAVVCLLAPIGVFFMKQAWARWLYGAPMAFFLLASVTILLEFQKVISATENMGDALGGSAGRAMARQAGPSVSPSIGAFLVLLSAIYLLTRIFARQD